MRTSSRLALLPLLLSLVGCARCQPPREGGAAPANAPQGPAAAAPAAPASPGRVGTVTGVVRLAEGAELPRYSPGQIGRSERTNAVSRHCPPARDSDTLPVRGVGNPTALVRVAVYATSDDAAAFRAALPTASPTERHVAIRDCRLEPRIVVGAVGDTLVIDNQSEDVFLPHVGSGPFMETLLHGESRRVTLDHLDAVPIACSFALACGRSDLVVMRYPVFDVTGEAGRFEIRNVPADQPVKIHAFHPLFREATVETRVARNGRVEVELVLHPVTAQIEAVPGAPTPPSTPPPGQPQNPEAWSAGDVPVNVPPPSGTSMRREPPR